GVVGNLYRYIGASNTGGATTDLIQANYNDTTNWQNVGPPRYDTSLQSPRTKLVSLHNNDIVLISQAGPTQPQANGTIGGIYRYIGASNTGGATTDLIATDYTDTTNWAAAYNTTPTVAGNTTKNVALNSGDLVLISQAGNGQPQADGVVG